VNILRSGPVLKWHPNKGVHSNPGKPMDLHFLKSRFAQGMFSIYNDRDSRVLLIGRKKQTDDGVNTMSGKKAAQEKKQTFGLLVGNRGFFPDKLAQEGRNFMEKLLKEQGYNVVALTDQDTKFGAVETWQDAKKCAALFRENADNISGVVVTLPNFGDERGVADTLKLAGLDVPVLVHAWKDNPANMSIDDRRDAFCGKMSVCNNLLQYGIPYTLTSEHTMDPSKKAFIADLNRFAAACRVVKGLRNCRVGALGARPAPFTTVRYSEKLLQEAGISVDTLDLSEAFGRIDALKDSDKKVKARLAGIKEYVDTKAAPEAAVLKMAKFGVVIDEWMAESDLDITAIQCWTSMEEFFGVVPCTIMSMLSNTLQSSACEVDVGGAIAMHALALASGSPSFLLDWNNNYGDDPDKCVAFHCSNLPQSCFKKCGMDYQAIIAGSVGKENTWGTVTGRIKPGPLSFARISTCDSEGVISAYVGEGRFTDDKLKTFGGYGVAEIKNLQALLRYICQNGFEHHVAMNHSEVAAAVHEAMDTYMGWDVYWHQ
jgi:L-fucose isomerase-like protein